jgi:hypothetical protein
LSTTQVEPAPFYFKSYGAVIGIARDLTDLERELVRLAQENPRAVEYHLKEGHIMQWLADLNERELARQLEGEYSVKQAQAKIAAYLDRKKPRSSGRASMHVPPHHHGSQIVV